MKRYTFLVFFLSFFSLLNAQNPFNPIPNCLDCSPFGVMADGITADMDGDGDLDLILAGNFPSQVVWFENLDGTGKYGRSQLILESSQSIRHIELADISGDGIDDLVLSLSFDVGIAWYSGTENVGEFGEEQVVFSSDATNFMSVQTVDLDLDGDMDIVATNVGANGVIWFENTDGAGTFSDATFLTEIGNLLRSVLVVDLDSDGDLDLLTVDNEFTMAWYEDFTGTQGFGPRQEILSHFFIDEVIVDDLDNDGDIDILFQGSETNVNDIEIKWMPNFLGSGVFEAPQIIGPSFVETAILTFDFDGDGDKDIATNQGFGSGIVVYENIDSNGTFEVFDTDSDFFNLTPQNILIADFDGDTDEDIFFINYENVGTLRNDIDSFTLHYAIAPIHYNIVDYNFKDLNGDGYLDLITNSFAFNPQTIHYSAGEGVFLEDYQILPSTIGEIINQSEVVDVDGDTDLDIIQSIAGEGIVWQENTDGVGNFSVGQSIFESTETIFIVGTEDIDSDGDLDILTSSSGGDIYWHQNTDGLGSFDNSTFIANDNINGTKYIKLVDFDADGDMDIIGGDFNDLAIVWFENMDGAGNFSPSQLLKLVAGYSLSLDVNDMDADGDFDFVYTDAQTGKALWLENEDGIFLEEKVIIENIDTPEDIISFDYDADGDMDVVVITTGTNANIIFCENRNIIATEWLNSTVILEGVTFINELGVADYDSDNDLDLFLLQNYGDFNRLLSFENTITSPAVNGTVYYDLNENNQRDAGEIGLNLNAVHIMPEAQFNFSNLTGRYRFVVDNGDYDLNISPQLGWVSTGTNEYSVSINDNIVQDLDFGLKPLLAIDAIDGTINSGPTRCGFTVPFWGTYTNIGTTFLNGTVSVTLDELVTPISFSPAPTMVDGFTFTWDIGNLPPTHTRNFEMELVMPGVESLGDSIHLVAEINLTDAAGEPTQTFNYTFSSEINCAYDPNDKRAIPAGEGDLGLTLKEEELEYIIRFQNTGTDTAFTVRIEDQLDADLDWTTFKPLAASHPYQVSLSDEGLVEYLFDDILLPDSMVNEAGSHGFFSFSIEPNEDLADYTEVTNRADIYFDFNPPILTNTTLNTYLSYAAVETDLEVNICEGETFTYNDVVYDAAGMYIDTIASSIFYDSITNINLMIITPPSPQQVDITPDVIGLSVGGVALDFADAENLTFLWSTGAQTQNLTDVLSGDYTVTITDENGCSSTFSYFVNLVTSVANQTETLLVNVNPNPFRQSTDISIGDLPVINAQLFIFDATGKEVLRKSVKSGDVVKVDGRDLNVGLYFYELRGVNSDKIYAKGKLLRQ